MKTSDLPYRTLVGALGLSLLSAACIINGGNDPGIDDDDNGGVSGDPPLTTGSGNTDGPSVSTGAATDATDTDSGGDTCSEAQNVVADPGFEGGSPNDTWVEASEIFDAIICDSRCTTEEGAEPYAGDFWVWFGGLEDTAEVASVEQTITIPEGEIAELSFWFQIRSGAQTGDDMFLVDMVDGDAVDPLFTATDLDMPEFSDGYHRVVVDVSPWADGGTYTLRFSADIAGVELTSFFLDEVELVSCTEMAGTSTGVEDTTAGVEDTTAGTTAATGETEGSTGTSTGSGTDTGTGTSTG